MANAVQATGREDTERRILLRFMRYDLPIQPASLVRGSSRRIKIVRFRPADIRLINRRTRLSPWRLLCILNYWLKPPNAKTIKTGT
jgi:hypothetical protein